MIDERFASGDNHHDVAGRHRALGLQIAIIDLRPRIQPRLDLRRCRCRQFRRRIGNCLNGQWQSPFFGLCRAAFAVLLVFGRRVKRPDLDTPRAVRTKRLVCNRNLRHAVTHAIVGKDGIHSAEHSRRGAERNVQRNLVQSFAAHGDLGFEIIAHLRKGLWISLKETVDRLLFVADDEQGASAIRSRAFARKIFIGERANNFPLRGACVLRFIDKDMINAAIKLKQYPRADIGPRKQPLRAHNQIIIIQNGLRLLFKGVGVHHPERKNKEAFRSLNQRERIKTLFKAEHPRGFCAHRHVNFWIAFDTFFVRKCLARFISG